MLGMCVRSRHDPYIAQSLLLTFFIPLSLTLVCCPTS